LFVISNEFVFSDENNLLVNIEKNVNPVNKEHVLAEKKFKFYENVILFGDTINDCYMAKEIITSFEEN